MKQQQQSQHNLGAPTQQGANINEFFKTQDPLSVLQANFNEINIKDSQMVRKLCVITVFITYIWKLGIGNQFL